MPVCAADWCAVTTVEGIGSTRTALHPVQERMTLMHGSQCGFCTPGIVMALYSLFRSDPSLPAAKMQEHLDGNLCRCTGYRSILDAARSLCPDSCETGTGADCAGSCAVAGSCGGGGCGVGGCGNGEADGGCPSGEPTGRLIDGDVVTDTNDKCKHFSTPYASSSAAGQEPEFPSELTSAAPPMRLCPAEAGAPAAVCGSTNGSGGGSSSSSGESIWWRPASLKDLLALRAEYPHARMVAGNSEVGIESRYKNHKASTFIFASAVAELKTCTDSDECMELGACAPLSEIEHVAAAAGERRAGAEGEVARAIAQMLRWFASTQIRNVACLGGNIATASPISDMIPLLVACGATMTVASKSAGTRVQPLSSFFLGYRKVRR